MKNNKLIIIFFVMRILSGGFLFASANNDTSLFEEALLEELLISSEESDAEFRALLDEFASKANTIDTIVPDHNPNTSGRKRKYDEAPYKLGRDKELEAKREASKKRYQERKGVAEIMFNSKRLKSLMQQKENQIKLQAAIEAKFVADRTQEYRRLCETIKLKAAYNKDEKEQAAIKAKPVADTTQEWRRLCEEIKLKAAYNKQLKAKRENTKKLSQEEQEKILQLNAVSNKPVRTDKKLKPQAKVVVDHEQLKSLIQQKEKQIKLQAAIEAKSVADMK